MTSPHLRIWPLQLQREEANVAGAEGEAHRGVMDAPLAK